MSNLGHVAVRMQTAEALAATAIRRKGGRDGMPRRFQMRRTRGWRKPAGAIYVGRPSKWGNPFVVGATLRPSDETWPFVERRSSKRTDRLPLDTSDQSVKVSDAAMAVELFACYLVENEPLRIAAREELTGRDLMCWCPIGSPCHGDYLLDFVNEGSRTPGPSSRS